MRTHFQGRLTLPVGSRDHIRGSFGAPVTLVEYGDYQCPYCGEANPIVEIQRRLNDGLCFVFRNFPLTEVPPHAEHAAEAAEASAAHGKFWEMHDILYTHQDALDDRHLAAYGASLGSLQQRSFKLFPPKLKGSEFTRIFSVGFAAVSMARRLSLSTANATMGFLISTHSSQPSPRWPDKEVGCRYVWSQMN
jgi:hypothetical protein